MLNRLFLLSLSLTFAVAQNVQLDYATYAPTTVFNGVTVFKNIRYAAPPVGDLRFAAPAPPLRENAVNNGGYGAICMQAAPQGQTTTPSPYYGESEDCLLLDVYVPPGINANSNVPVLVWLHGGGFVFGNKDVYTGIGLLQASNDSIIYVTPNYRLGAFGFLSGQTFSSQSGIPNAGLLDQRAAFNWVAANIAKFGGNPNAVTVMGESAGASSIMHHLTSYSGSQGVPFQRAIMQSPAFQPFFQPKVLDNKFNIFRTLAGCSNLSSAVNCLRRADVARLQKANLQQVSISAPYGTFAFGPAVDGNFIPNLPSISLRQGNFVRGIDIMLGFNANESFGFVNPQLSTQADFMTNLHGYLPDLSPDMVNAILTVYPDPPTSLYTTQFERMVLLLGDVAFTCNTRFISNAYDGNTWNYEFAVGEANHGQDLPYTFENSFLTGNGDIRDFTVAAYLQHFVTNLAVNGNPAAEFPKYGVDATVVRLAGANDIGAIKDPNANNRCQFWSDAPYYYFMQQGHF